MTSLIPAEYWQHSLADSIRGLAGAVRHRSNLDGLVLPGLGECIPARSARAGMVSAFRALGLPAGARIAVPLYCCPVVFKAIALAGFSARFIDVEPGTFCMSATDLRSKRKEFDAVVAVHMFGNLCDMAGILDAAQGAPVIEDCAQSLGSMIGGRAAGTFGEVSVFSFRTGKYLSAGEGGALWSGNQSTRSRLKHEIAGMPSQSGWGELKHIAITYVRSVLRSKPLYGILGYHLWREYTRRVDHTQQTPIVLSQMFRTDMAIVRSRLNRLHSAIQRQRANADYYSRTLNVDPSMICAEKPGTFSNRYLYPIAFANATVRECVASRLRRRGIGSIRPYSDIATVAAAHYGYTGDCPAAEAAATGILVVPSHHGLRASEVRRVAASLNDALSVCGGATTRARSATA